MKTKIVLIVMHSSLLLAAPALLAQVNFATNLASNSAANIANNFATNIFSPIVTNARTQEYRSALTGEQSLLPPGIKQQLKLTDEQKAELKPIEDDFAKTRQEYKAANQPRIDAANEANRQARLAKDKAQIQAARTQLQQVWAGLQPHRAAALTRIKPLLTPDQLKILEDPKNQWRENAFDEAQDPSAN